MTGGTASSLRGECRRAIAKLVDGAGSFLMYARHLVSAVGQVARAASTIVYERRRYAEPRLRLLTVVISASLALLCADIANGAGAQAWTISLHLHNPQVGPDQDFYGTQTYATKAQAVAALKQLDPHNYGHGDTLLQEMGISSMSSAAVTYSYGLPVVPGTFQPYVSFSWYWEPGGALGLGYRDEASAVAAITSGPCTPTHNSSTVSPAGDWVPGPGWSAENDRPPPNNIYQHRAYTQTTQEYDTITQACVSSVNPLQLVGQRFVSCPDGYIISYDASANQYTCSDVYSGIITGKLLECPGTASAPTQVGDPCDVSSGDFSQSEVDYASAGLNFNRYYHSAVLESHHSLGVGWTHSYGAYLVLEAGLPVGLLRPDGHHDAVQNINGQYEVLSGAGIHIQPNLDQATPTLSWSYGYDAVDRLTAASTSSQTQSFAYDADGNRVTQGGTSVNNYAVSSSSNQLNSISGALTRTYSYDASGDVLAYDGISFTYNNAGRMVSTTGASGMTTYMYNAVGQRIRKVTGSSATYFLYDEVGHLIGEYDGSGTAIQEIVWLGDTPVATIRTGSCGVSIFYIHTDHLNTPRLITRRSTAEVVWRWDSDPFGTTAPNENPSGLGIFTFNLRMPGQYFDAESGLNYNMARHYDSATAKYVESDPIGLGGGINTYAYAYGDAVNKIDPQGLRPPTDAEAEFIRKHIGGCLDPKSLNIKVRKYGNTLRAVSFGGGFTSFPSYYFEDDSGDNQLRLDNTYIASVVGHEALHQMQRASGVNVTRKGIGLQIQNSLGSSDVYQYTRSADPVQMLETFLNGNVEQQGQIFQDYLFDVLNGRDVSAYSWIASYVKGNCACAK